MKDYSETEWDIREAEEEDAWEILDIFSSAYDSYPYTDEVYDSVQDDEVYVLAAEIDDEIIGTASLIPRGNGRYEFGRTAIKEDAQGKKSEERSLFRDLIDERSLRSDEIDAELLITNAVAEHGITQNVYSSEGFSPVLFRPYAKADKNGTGIRGSNIMMAKPVEEDHNRGGAVFASAEDVEIVDGVISGLGYERDLMEGLGYYGDLDIAIERDDKNDLTQVSVTSAESGEDLNDLNDILDSARNNSEAVELFLDANSPLASDIGSMIPDNYHSTGFIPEYLEGGNDALVFSYWNDEANKTTPGFGSEKVAELTVESKDLVENSGAWDSHSMKPHDEIGDVYEVFANKSISKTILGKIRL